jgi:hypothetical protein
LQVADGCHAIKLPANAYLVADGDDWKCKRGFHKSGDTCQPIAIPEHAYLRRSGDDWACERPYLLRGEQCIEP